MGASTSKTSEAEDNFIKIKLNSIEDFHYTFGQHEMFQYKMRSSDVCTNRNEGASSKEKGVII